MYYALLLVTVFVALSLVALSERQDARRLRKISSN